MVKGRLGSVFALCLLGTPVAGVPAASAADVVTDYAAALSAPERAALFGGTAMRTYRLTS